MKKIKESDILKIVETILKEGKDDWIKISPEELIHYLEHVGYSMKALMMAPRFKGKKIWITGNLNLENKPINSLGNIKYVEGSLDLDHTMIGDIPKDVKVGSRISYDYTPYERKLERIRLKAELDEAHERRENNEWSIESADKIGLKAHALFKFLVKGNKLDPSGADVYNLIPEKRDYGNFTIFRIYEIDDFDSREEWSVATQEEADEALSDYVDEIISDAGNMLGDRIEYYIDDDQVEEMAREDYENVVRYSPEDYLEDSDKQLSDDQTEQIEQLEREKLEAEEERIMEIDSEIEDIKNDPDGDYSEEAIDNKIEKLVKDATYDSYQYLRDLGYEGESLLPYLDKDKLKNDLENEESYGSMNSYNGDYDEIEFGGTYYVIMMTDK